MQCFDTLDLSIHHHNIKMREKEQECILSHTEPGSRTRKVCPQNTTKAVALYPNSDLLIINHVFLDLLDNSDLLVINFADNQSSQTCEANQHHERQDPK